MAARRRKAGARRRRLPRLGSRREVTGPAARRIRTQTTIEVLRITSVFRVR